MAAKFWKMPGKFQNLAAKILKGLTQNSTQKLKVEIKLCVDSENFMKNIKTLLSSIILNECNCLNISNWDTRYGQGDLVQFLRLFDHRIHG